MTLQEAIREAMRTDLWFRPVGVKGQAYAVDGGWCVLVPGLHGAVHVFEQSASALLGEWEVVAPRIVCDERT